MNHELARELLWIEYPTDQRGTTSRQFWSRRDTGTAADSYDLVQTLDAAGTLTLEQLGERPGAAASPLVLVVKGPLVQRYPGMLVTAAKTKPSGATRVLDPATEIQPDFMARLEPEVLLVGFESLSADTVRTLAANPDTAWWFFFAEHFSEPRFGLDLPAAGDPATLADWNDASWSNAMLDAAGRLGAASFSATPLPKTRPGLPPGPSYNWHGEQLVDRVDPAPVPVPPRHPRARPAAACSDASMSGIDSQLPVTLLPVRIETRFSGTPAAPRLLVRLYPDDLHIDHHDPRLTAAEIAAGQRYWTSVRGDTDADQAWAQLLKDAGATRALWVREALTPTNPSGAPSFPTPASVAGNAGVAATARALPACFVVRVRSAGGMQVVQGLPIPASLQVGVSFGTPASDAPPAPAPPTSDDATLVLDEGLRWMVDFDAALAVGMAVEVDLPPNTSLVQDVVAVGLPVGDADGAALLDDARRRAPLQRRRRIHRARHADQQPRRFRERLHARRGAGTAARVRAGGRLGRRRARRRLGHRPARTRAAARRRGSRARRGAADGPRAVRGDLGRLPAPAGPAGLRPEPAAARVRARDHLRARRRPIAGSAPGPPTLRDRPGDGARRLGADRRERVRAVAREVPARHPPALDLGGPRTFRPAPSYLRSSRSRRGCACAPPTSAPRSRTWRRCKAPSSPATRKRTGARFSPRSASRR